jgi:hypothetical protein
MRTEAFRLYTVPGKLVDPDLDLDKTSALVMNYDEEAYRSDCAQCVTELRP